MEIVFGNNLTDVVFVQEGDISPKTSVILLPNQKLCSAHSTNMKVSKVVHDPSGVYPVGTIIASAFIGIQNFSHEYMAVSICAIANKAIIGKLILDPNKEEFRPYEEISEEQLKQFGGNKGEWTGGRDMSGISSMNPSSTIIMP